MYIYIYVYIYICVYVYIYMYIYIYIHLSLSIYIHIYVYTYTYVLLFSLFCAPECRPTTLGPSTLRLSFKTLMKRRKTNSILRCDYKKYHVYEANPDPVLSFAHAVKSVHSAPQTSF